MGLCNTPLLKAPNLFLNSSPGPYLRKLYQREALRKRPWSSPKGSDFSSEELGWCGGLAAMLPPSPPRLRPVAARRLGRFGGLAATLSP
eukprot:1857011-Pyramimonas_sp.AAC.1